MDRRNFLQLAALALAGKAAERVWPFRVYSIPKEIVVAKPVDGALTIEMLRTAQKQIMERLGDPEEITIRATRVHVYSPDGKEERGSFLASIEGGKVLGRIPDGIIAGDILVPEFLLPKLHLDNKIDFFCSDSRTGRFINLERA